MLKSLSVETWERIGFARKRKGLKIWEVTVTQNLLYLLKKYSEYCSTSIQMLEATNEKINGNDIEICIKTKAGYILLPTQAKILYSTGDYPRIKHPSQIENLIEYAKKIKGIPLHLFYNFDEIYANDEYGCTIMKTKKLLLAFGKGAGTYDIDVPKFLDLHPSKAKPWHEFLCSGFEEDADIQYYEKEELIKSTEWKEFTLLEVKKEHLVDSNYRKLYTPRFRIILDIEGNQESK